MLSSSADADRRYITYNENKIILLGQMSDASHWCKNVIETVVPTVTSLNPSPRYSVPPPMPPSAARPKSALDMKVQELLGSTVPTTGPTPMASSQYMQLYQQYYQNRWVSSCNLFTSLTNFSISFKHACSTSTS
jgi:hypothetical protein